jgi:hypothetical protein
MTRALKGDRVLSLAVPHYVGTYVDAALQWPGNNGWQPTSTGVFHEQYFDLSGYELDDLTLVPKFMQLQDGGNPYAGGLGVSALHVWDIISQERLDPSQFLIYAVTGDYPGSPATTQDWSQILMCNKRYMTGQTVFTSANLFLPASSGSFGSSEPTAVAKLWCYRIIVTGGTLETGDILNIPATRFVLGGTVIDEPDLEYMMRLKRSYELGTDSA